MLEFTAGFAVASLISVGLFFAYRALLRYKATPNHHLPERIAGAYYWIIPDEEYQNFLTARDLVRASLKRVQMRGKPTEIVEGESPYYERRKEQRPFPEERRGVRSRPDHDTAPWGERLKPGA